MPPESEVLQHAYTARLIMRVVVADVCEHSDLYQRLLVKATLVTNNLDGDQPTLSVVKCLDDLSKRAFADKP